MGFDGHTDTAGRVGNPLPGESVTGDRKSFVELSQNVRARNAHILELELGGISGGPKGVDDASNVESWGVGINDKAGDAAAPSVWRCSREYESIVGAISAADPEFAAIDDPVVAILNGSGLNGPGWV